MLKNYLLIAVRNLRKQKGFAFINVAGLAIGMACVILIGMYVTDELSYDRYHENSRRIYRLVRDTKFSETVRRSVPLGAPFAPLFQQNFPEIEAFARFRHTGESEVTYDAGTYVEGRFFYADSSVFEVFTIPILEGRSEEVLTAPYTVAISESTAKRYFGDRSAIGNTLVVQDAEYEVTTVFQDVPTRSHIHFDFLASFITLEDLLGESLQALGHSSYYTYFLFNPEASPETVLAILPEMTKRYVGPELAGKMSFVFQPLKDLHLKSNRESELEPPGSLYNIYIFSAIALFILILACVNFMNLSTARAARRSLEVGIRKAIGAHHRQLVSQFLGESLLMAFLATGAGLVLAAVFLPAFNEVAGKSLDAARLGTLSFIAGLILLAGIVGTAAGSYPAFFLSRFQPSIVLKGGSGGGVRGGHLLVRKFLVVFQFSVSIILVIGTLVVADQLDYLRNRSLGFNKSQVLGAVLRSDDARENYNVLKEEWKRLPGVTAIAASSGLIGSDLSDILYQTRELSGMSGLSIATISVDYDFLSTMEIELVTGRFFDERIPTDERKAFLLNVAAAKRLGWTVDEAIGKEITWPSSLIDENSPPVKIASVVGVVRNFHFASLHETIQPLLIQLRLERPRYLTVRLAATNLIGTVGQLERIWSGIAPESAFDFVFLDQQFDSLYRAEERFGSLFRYFSVLAIFIACLGLLGLASYTAEQRTKEIGIRKVMGASTGNIVGLLTRDFSMLVVVSIFFAIPVSYFLMDRWLENFAYQAGLGVVSFVSAGLAALLIAWLTVGYQALKAAVADPVNALRHE